MGSSDDQIDRKAKLRERGGKLDAEQTAADDAGDAAVSFRGVLAGSGEGATFVSGVFDGMMQAIGLGERAQIVNIGELGAGNVQLAGGAAGGDEELVEENFLAVLERDALAVGVEVEGAHAGVQLDAVFAEPADIFG